MDGFEVGNRRDDTCSADLVGNRFEERQLFLGWELIGDRPSRCLGCVAEFVLLGEVIDLEHDAVGGNRQVLALGVPVGDVVHHLIDRVTNLDGIGYMETPLSGCFEPFVMGLAGQVLADHVIEIGVQSASCHLTRVLQFERTRSGIAGIGEQGLFLLLALFVESFEAFPGKEYFAAQFEEIRHVGTVDLPRNGRDGLDVGNHIIALLPVAPCECPDELAALVPQRNGQAVVLEFAHDLCVRRELAHPVFNLFARIGVRQRQHRVLVLDGLEAFLAEV